MKTATAVRSLWLLYALSTSAFAQTLTVEAESMTRTNYSLDGSYIKVTDGVTSGTASAVFSGATGTYDIQVHVRAENDGRPTLAVYSNSVQLHKYVYPATTSSQTSASYKISGKPLATGDVIKLAGYIDGGALARVDKLVFTPVSVATSGTTATASATEPVTQTIAGTTSATSSSTATTTVSSTAPAPADSSSAGLMTSRAKTVRISDGLASGSATTTFTGVYGLYHLHVHVVPQPSGQPTVAVYKGTQLMHTLTVPLGDGQTARFFTITNVPLAAGDVVRVVGQAHDGTAARVDKIVIAPAAFSSSAPQGAGSIAATPLEVVAYVPPVTVPELPAGGRAVATFESLGLYWTPGSNPGAAGCTVRYRKAGESSWKDGLPMWYDARNAECRGSVVHLSPGTSYDVQLGLPGQNPSVQLQAATWSENLPIKKIVQLPNGTSSQTLAITEGGNSAEGYVLYTAPPGGQSTIDVADAQSSNITISAPYVIIRGLTLKGAKQDAIKLLSGARDVVIEDNDISGWGRYRTTGTNGVKFGMDLDAAVRCASVATLERVVIQRNRIHHPRYSANSWSFGHPEGPQGITLETCGGNHVIRHNEISSEEGRYFNDGMGGGSNFSDKGFPNYDSDIYGNLIKHTWDDAIEAEGGNRNVRIWGNYFDQTALGVATTVAHHGPVYVWRNVYNRSRMRSESAPDADDRNAFAKSGTGRGYGNGRRYVFHNTLLQAPPVAGASLTSGPGVGLVGPSSTEQLTNTVSRNNVWHIWKAWWASIDEQGGTGNDVDYDLSNGQIRTARGSELNGIVGTPIYAAGHGWSSESNGNYQLAPNSPGYDKGQKLANFNEGFTGTGPDVGAHEAGTAAMKFGVGAGTRGY